MNKSFFRKITFYLSAPRCINCGVGLCIDESALCNTCKGRLFEEMKRDCSLCHKPLTFCSCSPEYVSNHFVKRLSKVFRYKGKSEGDPASSLIYCLKSKGRADAVRLASDLIIEAVRNVHTDLSDTIVTSVPRKRSSISKYGHDHAMLLAKRIAKELSLEYKPLLKSKSKMEQKHLTLEERMKNIDLRPRREYDLRGKKILIVDDVVTTGATLGAAASVIRSLGCKDICGAALAIAYRDKDESQITEFNK